MVGMVVLLGVGRRGELAFLLEKRCAANARTKAELVRVQCDDSTRLPTDVKKGRQAYDAGPTHRIGRHITDRCPEEDVP